MAESKGQYVEKVKSDENLAKIFGGCKREDQESIEVIGRHYENLGVSDSYGLVLFSNVCESYKPGFDITCNCIIMSETLQLQPDDKIWLYKIDSKNPNDCVVGQCIVDVIENETKNEDGLKSYSSIRQLKVTFNACNLPKTFDDTYYQFRYVSGGGVLGASTLFCIRGQCQDEIAVIPLVVALQKQTQKLKAAHKSLYDENKLLESNFLKLVEQLDNFSKEKTETDKNVKMLEDKVNGLRKLKEGYVYEKWWKTRFNYVSIASVVLIVATSSILLKVGTNDKEELVKELKEGQNMISNYKEEFENSVRELKEEQNMISNYKEEFENSVRELKEGQSMVSNYKEEFENLVHKLDPVPISFIYVQLPNEESPAEIWSSLTWNDVSSAYAGVFFRVLGGEAASFGQVQEDNAPRLHRVYRRIISRNCSYNVLLPKDGKSKSIYTGHACNGDAYNQSSHINFEMLGGEVRPRNMAIRVWKRTG
jgi:predicted  nucleic acid-binding Zn-ribbon protein